MKCQCEDDNGHLCGKEVSKRQWQQDGMCSRCADELWLTFNLPILNGKEPKPFIHKETLEKAK